MRLPKTHYDHFRSTNSHAFKYFVEDLKTLRSRKDIRLEDILPPNADCAENAYVQSWAEHVRRHPEMHPELQGGQQAINAVMNHIVREYRFVLGYEHCERKTYFITDGLCEALTYTQLNVNCDEFQLPVECFCLVFNCDDARTTYSGISGAPAKPNTTITVYVRDDNLDEVGFRRLLVCAYETGADGTQHSCVSRQLALKSDWDMEKALSTDWDKISLAQPVGTIVGAVGMKSGPDGKYEIKEPAMETFFEEGRLFFRLVLNCILYITSKDAEMAPQSDGVLIGLKNKVSERATLERRFLEVGRSVEGMAIVIGPSSEPLSPTSPHGGRRVKVRFLVPGFYRRPPNSPTDAKKSVWVRPHRKGPEMADLVHKPYIVK